MVASIETNDPEEKETLSFPTCIHQILGESLNGQSCLQIPELITASRNVGYSH
jgi:hypothetical protein